MVKIKTGTADFGALWRMLAKNAPAPVTELQFHPSRKWRFDFAWPDAKVAVEIEGGTFSGKGSRHTSGIGHHRDCDKYNAAAIAGWCVIKFTSYHLRESPGVCVAMVREAIEARP